MHGIKNYNQGLNIFGGKILEITDILAGILKEVVADKYRPDFAQGGLVGRHRKMVIIKNHAQKREQGLKLLHEGLK